VRACRRCGEGLHRWLLHAAPKDRPPECTVESSRGWPPACTRQRWVCQLHAFRPTPCDAHSRPESGGAEVLWRIGETRRLEPLGPWPRGAATPRSPDGVARGPVPGSPAVRADCERTHIAHRSPLRFRPWALAGWRSKT
jgi:hypothetical protein